MKTMQTGIQKALEKINQSVDDKLAAALGEVNKKVDQIASQRPRDPVRNNSNTGCPASPSWASHYESPLVVTIADLHWPASDEEGDQSTQAKEGKGRQYFWEDNRVCQAGF